MTLEAPVSSDTSIYVHYPGDLTSSWRLGEMSVASQPGTGEM